MAWIQFEDDLAVDITRLVGTSVHAFGSVVHVALSFDDTTATLYANGTAEAMFDATGRPPVAYGPGSVLIGVTPVFARLGFPRSPNGIIDELEIFNYALTGDQIEQIYLTEGACKLPEEPSPEVDVDIKPGSDDNPINLGAGGGKSAKSEKNRKSKRGKKSWKSGKGNANIPVAILTTDDFDTTLADIESKGVNIWFGPVSLENGKRIVFISGPDHIKIELMEK